MAVEQNPCGVQECCFLAKLIEARWLMMKQWVFFVGLRALENIHPE